MAHRQILQAGRLGHPLALLPLTLWLRPTSLYFGLERALLLSLIILDLRGVLINAPVLLHVLLHGPVTEVLVAIFGEP